MTTYTLTGACSASWRPTRLAEGVKEPAASEAYDLSCDSCRCEHYQLFSTGWKEGVAQTEQGLGGLLHADCRELSQEQGLGEASIALIKAALEMGKRLHTLPAGNKYQITAPADVARLVMPDMAHLDYEQLRVIVLDTKNRVVSNMPLYRGTVNSSVLRAAEIFRQAITRNCPGIIVCHNHPTGLPEPSPEDVAVTNQLVAAGKVLDIELVDHLIIGHQQFVSLKERLRW
jgi:DNA repair protein RadC